MPDRLVIEIRRPQGRVLVPDSRGDPEVAEEPITGEAWIQGLVEAAMGGIRAWCAGADVYCEPQIYLDPVVLPVDPEDVPF
jgi:hypothetical protein